MPLVSIPSTTRTLSTRKCTLDFTDELGQTIEDYLLRAAEIYYGLAPKEVTRDGAMILTDTTVHALGAEAAKRQLKMKRTTSRKVHGENVPKKEVKSVKRQKDTEETCQCLVWDEPFGNNKPGEKWVQ